MAAAHPSRATFPKGQIFIAAAASACGWSVMIVDESRVSWQHFRDSILMPRIKQGIGVVFTIPTEETTFEVYTQMPKESVQRQHYRG